MVDTVVALPWLIKSFQEYIITYTQYINSHIHHHTIYTMYIKVIHTLHFLAQSPELICGSFKDALHQKEQQPLARSEGRTIVGGDSRK